MRILKIYAPALAVILIILILVTAFWAPAILKGRTLIHGDSLLHSLALWQYQKINLATPENLIWDKYTYGGHPLFAEGQGGFAFPLHILLARVTDPVNANTLAHWMEMLLSAVAIVGLGRLLKLSFSACGFAAIAAIFSSYWIQMQQNMTISAAAMTIPWMLWAGEYWLQRLNSHSALLLGSAVALGIVAGYPQCVHGAILYISATLFTRLAVKSSRDEISKNISALLKTGMLAGLVALGLCAIQLLPLLELTQYSHRADGTVAPWFKLPLASFIRGLLFDLELHELDPPNFFQVIGSLLTCVLFTLGFLCRAHGRLFGHAIAALLLLNLGMGGASPFTQIVYDYHLIPGMHYFRHMAPYFLVANIGVGVIAGSAIDNIARWLNENDVRTARSIVVQVKDNKFKLAALTAIWIATFAYAGFEQSIALKQTALTAAALTAAALLAKFKWKTAIPPCLVLALAADVWMTKIHEFQFGGRDVVEKPAVVAAIEADPGHEDYKFFSASFMFAYAMGSPQQQGMELHAKKMLAHLCGLSNLGWRIPSMMGALALPLRERMILEKIFDDEINARSSATAGLRFIDLLGVRYIAADAPIDNPTFKTILHDPATNTWLFENVAAKPRFQAYANYAFVKSNAESASILREANAPVLALEIPSYIDRKLVVGEPPPGSASLNSPQMDFTLITDTPTLYRLKVKANAEGWLFLADANYPGWHAYIDDREIPVYTAQILGKAIHIPAGEHDVRIGFQSRSFIGGRRITLTTLFATLIFGTVLTWRKRHT